MSESCRVDRGRVIQLIWDFTYMVGSSRFDPETGSTERELLSAMIDRFVEVAWEVRFDLWSEVAAPCGAEEYEPVAVILRRASIQHGNAGTCAAYPCRQPITALRRRPSAMPLGTRWPPCPELCFVHAELRNAILLERVIQCMPDHEGPVSAGGMPLPQFAHLAPEPWRLNESNIAS